MCHDSDERTEETPASRPGFLVVKQSDNRQDYTIHPYFVLGAVFPPQPSSSCPGPLSQSLSVPVIPFKKVIPPSHRKTESPVLITEKTVLIKEKAAASVSVPASVSASNNELSESLLPFSLSFDSEMVTTVQASVPVLNLFSSSLKCIESSCHPFDVCYGDFGTQTPTPFSHLL
jgi:hypothetical protein